MKNKNKTVELFKEKKIIINNNKDVNNLFCNSII